MSVETLVQVCCGIYIVLGIPVAYYHMRQQNMAASAQKCGGKGYGMIVFALASMWPLLLLSMGLNRLNRKSNPPQRSISKRESAQDSMELERPERRLDLGEFDRLSS